MTDLREREREGSPGIEHEESTSSNALSPQRADGRMAITCIVVVAMGFMRLALALAALVALAVAEKTASMSTMPLFFWSGHRCGASGLISGASA